MKFLLGLEEFSQLAFAVLGLYLQPISISWWLWPLVFLSPDISMLGYLGGSRLGAISYNLFHHKGVAICIGLAGYFASEPIMIFIGLLLFGHSALDRMLGYGLKYETGFKHTHLGELN